MKKRSVVIAGHPTSITLEDAFWAELKAIAAREKTSLNKLITQIDDNRNLDAAHDFSDDKAGQNLSSTLRLYILSDLKQQIKKQQGHDDHA